MIFVYILLLQIDGLGFGNEVKVAAYETMQQCQRARVAIEAKYEYAEEKKDWQPTWAECVKTELRVADKH